MDLEGAIFCHILEEHDRDEFNWGRVNQFGDFFSGGILGRWRLSLPRTTAQPFKKVHVVGHMRSFN